MPNKTFFTYEQQIEKLTKEKQLVISDTEFAKDILQKLSYFSLIGGYKNLFKHTPSGKYLHGVTFEELPHFTILTHFSVNRIINTKKTRKEEVFVWLLQVLLIILSYPIQTA